MKKVIFSLAGLLATAAFAPEASAVPAFARQVGMACNACHFQKFPVLNSFGRAFKASGYTMMGVQGKVEGEHLSLPGNLNAAVLFTAEYIKDERTPPTGTLAQNQNNGSWRVPREMALFLAGRVSDNIGFFSESNLAGGNTAGGIVVGFKLPMIFDVGGAKVGLVPFFNDGGAGGPANAYELSSSGAQDNIRWSLMNKDIGHANAYVINGGIPGGATGVAFVAKNDMGYINFTPYTTSNMVAGNAPAGRLLGDNRYLRVAATPNLGGFDMHIGVQHYSGGSDYQNTGAAPLLVTTVTRATIVDLQAQGQVGGNDIAIYSSYGRAPFEAGAVPNLLNPGATASDRTAFTIGADYTVIPNALILGAGYRHGKSGAAGTTVGETDNGFMIQADYHLYQNVQLNVSYAKYSGSAYDATGSTPIGGVGQGTGKNKLGFTLESAF